MLTPLRHVLAGKGPEVTSIEPTATVRAAVHRMVEARTGSVLVVDGDAIAGIFTERDLMRRVVAPGRDPDAVRVAEVMTAPILTVSPRTTVGEALAIITEKRHRHLPVVDGDRLVGLISAGDLARWLARERAFEVEQLTRYIAGTYPG